MTNNSNCNLSTQNQDYYISGNALYEYCTPYGRQGDGYNYSSECNHDYFIACICTPDCRRRCYKVEEITDPCQNFGAGRRVCLNSEDVITIHNPNSGRRCNF